MWRRHLYAASWCYQSRRLCVVYARLLMSHSRIERCCYLHRGISLSPWHRANSRSHRYSNILRRWLVLPYLCYSYWRNCRSSGHILMSFRNFFSIWECHILHFLHIGLLMWCVSNCESISLRCRVLLSNWNSVPTGMSGGKDNNHNYCHSNCKLCCTSLEELLQQISDYYWYRSWWLSILIGRWSRSDTYYCR